LNDAEFTELLRRRIPGGPDGFSILCFSDGCLTLSVPDQKLDDWYPKDSWITPKKEEIARMIAEKHGLTFCEPPDKLNYIVLPAEAHHHVELVTRWEAVVVAHPFYLKLRLYSTRSADRSLWTPQASLLAAEDLIRELVALYRRP
jgi:hypothetical protein